MKTLFTYVLFLAPVFLCAQDLTKVNIGVSPNHLNVNGVFGLRYSTKLLLTSDLEVFKEHDPEMSETFIVGGIGVAYGTTFGDPLEFSGSFRAGAGLALCRELKSDIVKEENRVVDKVTTTYSGALDLEYRRLFFESEVLSGGFEKDEEGEIDPFADLVCRLGVEFLPRLEVVAGFHSFLQEYTAELGYDLGGRKKSHLWLLGGVAYAGNEKPLEPSIRISYYPWE